MFIHILIGALVLALVCFGIGLLAGGPDLVGRRRRARRIITPPRQHEESRIEVRPVINNRPITRADMQIEP